MQKSEPQVLDHHELIAQRRKKLSAWRESGKAYPNDFHRNTMAAKLLMENANKNEMELTEHPIVVKIAGRMMTRRQMGKASFAHLQDMSGRIQVYIRQDELGESIYDMFKEWDL